MHELCELLEFIQQQILAAKLSMIDLAGSERGTTTGCGNVRFTEGSNINRFFKIYANTTHLPIPLIVIKSTN